MFLPQKTPKIYECKSCDFVTRNQKDYNRHLLTRKHQNTTKYNDFTPKNPKLFCCECGKQYPYRSSLYNHRKNCKILIEFEKNQNNEKKDKEKNENKYQDLLLTMIKQNKDTNELYYKLIKRFNEITDCPVLINTSFNVRGEPIVNTPKDAFRCFMGTKLDFLVIGNCFLDKTNQSAELKTDYKDSFELD